MLFSGTVLTLKAAFLGINLLMPTLATTITASVLPALGLLGGTLAVLAGIAYHKEIAAQIDDAAPGIGDWLYRMNHHQRQEGLDAYYDLPPSKGNSTTITTNVHLDGRLLASVVTDAPGKAANGPLTSGGGFDGRMSHPPAWGL